MTQFSSPDQWSEPIGGIRYRTTRTIDWGVGASQSKLRMQIPAGRPFDVSVPKGLRWLIDPHAPQYRLAGLIHDELLHVHNWTRMRAGGEFHDALRAGGVHPCLAIAMWLAVSIFRYPLETQSLS